MFQVIKRDGSKSDFTLTKINDAIMKAFTATQMSYNNDIIDLLALRVTADFQKKVENDEIHVEDIQDSVERVLGQAGYEEVAKAYILYRKQREKMRGTCPCPRTVASGLHARISGWSLCWSVPASC